MDMRPVSSHACRARMNPIAANMTAACTLCGQLRPTDCHQRMNPMQAIETLIDDAFERRNALTQAEIETHLRPAIDQVLDLLESGERRAAGR